MKIINRFVKNDEVNKEGKKKKASKIWIVYTLLFTVVTLLSLATILYDPLVGTYMVLLLLLFFSVGRIIRAYCIYGAAANKIGEIQTLSNKDIENIQKLLRYATSVLALLSLITTANGMRGFVFDSEWMAYFASFAVQSILVVFSLLLCRFVVRVTALEWPEYIKKLVNETMVFFFCIFLLVSSFFSFSYISNNAYKMSWINDSEIMIQNYLIDITYELKNENNYRKEKILSEINNTAQNSLIEAVQGLHNQEEEELTKRLVDKLDNCKMVYTSKDKNKVSLGDRDEWMRLYPGFAFDSGKLYDDYKRMYETGYVEAITTYNDIVGIIQNWSQMNEKVDISNIYSESAAVLKQINDAQSLLQSLMESIDEWRTYRLNIDISSYRGEFKANANMLENEFNNLEEDVILIRKIASDFIAVQSNSSTDEIDLLLSQVYLLGTDEDIKIEDLVERINSIIINGKDSFTNTAIRDIVLLKDKLTLYDKSLKLEEKIDSYIENQLSRTYKINLLSDNDVEEAEVDEKKQMNLSETNTKEETDMYLISREEWEKCRNRDFYTFYTYAKSLPDIEHILSKKDMENRQSYDSMDIIAKASIMQRDLLGELTDIERALNYFKYDFPVMAFFSAFIAVFFDLGAFFAGCFIYVTEFFSEKTKSENDK